MKVLNKGGRERHSKGKEGGAMEKLERAFDLQEETYPDPRGMYRPIPLKVIEILIKQGWITFPIPPEQEWGMKLLQKIWGDKHKTFLRFMLSEMDHDERVLMAEFPRYTKIDRFVLRLLLNVEELVAAAESGGTVKPKPRKYSSKEIRTMVWSYFGQSVSDGDLNRLRQTARDYRRGRVSKKSKANLLRVLADTV